MDSASRSDPVWINCIPSSEEFGLPGAKEPGEFFECLCLTYLTYGINRRSFQGEFREKGFVNRIEVFFSAYLSFGYVVEPCIHEGIILSPQIPRRFRQQCK
jgi:hypothetical protein